MKDSSVFDVYENWQRERLVTSMLASNMASHFLSPNGYLAYTANFDALISNDNKN